MSKVSYVQARADHEYLWGFGPANDMTGGYVDQEDLHKLLKAPNKATAAKCYAHQIEYWFQVGPDASGRASGCCSERDRLLAENPKVREIYSRYVDDKYDEGGQDE